MCTSPDCIVRYSQSCCALSAAPVCAANLVLYNHHKLSVLQYSKGSCLVGAAAALFVFFFSSSFTSSSSSPSALHNNYRSNCCTTNSLRAAATSAITTATTTATLLSSDRFRYHPVFVTSSPNRRSLCPPLIPFLFTISSLELNCLAFSHNPCSRILVSYSTSPRVTSLCPSFGPLGVHSCCSLTAGYGTVRTPARAMLDLPGAEDGKVVTRFPPEPSGYLHIGHAKAALLNQYFARQYHGKFILRFDDTNPAKEKMEFENSIKEDLAMLNISPDQVTHTSDYFDELQSYMKALLVEGKAYVDNTEPEKMKADRNEGIESSSRCNNTIEDNLRLWTEMIEGSTEGQTCCVRLRLNMRDKNKCMRDPTMYRCVANVPHHRFGNKYKAYPTYDFACPIVDSLESVTHAMRTNEYSDRIPQYKKVLELTGLRDVIIYEFSRLNFVRSVLSKRKLQWFVDNKLVEGWSDPRFPTVRGILRRGLLVDALLQFLLEQGPSKAGNLMQWDKLWAKNKQLLDPIVPRFMAVDYNDKVLLKLSNGPSEVETKDRDLHPKDPGVGQVVQAFSNEVWLDKDDAELIEEGEEITLMRWGNAIVDKLVSLHTDKPINSAEEGESMVNKNALRELQGRLHLEGDFKKTKKKVHWLPNVVEPIKQFKGLTRCVLREYDHLIIEDKIDKEDTRPMDKLINPHTQFDTMALTEGAVKDLPIGTVLQFERRGYFKIDKKPISADADGVEGKEGDTAIMVLIKVPVSRPCRAICASVSVRMTVRLVCSNLPVLDGGG
eukprot:GHVQ01012125.1.p1 GENE.GHVQ01012125.1~~GHVQ01012125.1.p1  ORF type:complete len:778 (-),score=118.18 GHVQ01012125.1:116-2449(-)